MAAFFEQWEDKGLGGLRCEVVLFTCVLLLGVLDIAHLSSLHKHYSIQIVNLYPSKSRKSVEKHFHTAPQLTHYNILTTWHEPLQSALSKITKKGGAQQGLPTLSAIFFLPAYLRYMLLHV